MADGNDYFNADDYEEVAANTLARAAQVNSIASAVVAGFDKLPDLNSLNDNSVTYAEDTGTANAYVITLNPALVVYRKGLSVTVKVLHGNTGPSTLNAGPGNKALVNTDGTDLEGGALEDGTVFDATYDGTKFYIKSVTVNGAVAAASALASAIAAAASAVTAASNASTSTTQATTATTQAGIATAQATIATTQGTLATTKAGAAATSATNAATSETNAATSASAASTSATAAGTSQTAAAASATTAGTLAAGVTATSTSNVAIPAVLGTLSLTTQSGKQFLAGQPAIAFSAADPTQFVSGRVASYSGTAFVLNAEVVGGTGSHNDWVISISGLRGAAGSMTGPGVAVDSNLAAYSGTSGAILKDSGIALANLALLNAQQSFTRSQQTSNYALTDGATITPDFSQANEGYVVLAGNRTLGVPTGLVAGNRVGYEFDIIQDGTGTRTLAYAWVYSFSFGVAPTLTTTAGGRDKLFLDVAYWNTTATAAITAASPAVVTWAGHGLVAAGQKIQLSSGTLPTGLSLNTTYFAGGISGSTFKLASSLANAAAGTFINTTGSSQTGISATIASIDVSLAQAMA